jgi:hypothetical protein
MRLFHYFSFTCRIVKHAASMLPATTNIKLFSMIAATAKTADPINKENQR